MRRHSLHLACCAAFAILGVLGTQAQSPVSGVFFHEGWESGTASGSFNSHAYGNAAGTQFSVQNLVFAAGNWALRHRYLEGMQPGEIQYATQHFGDAISGPVHSSGQGQHFYDLYVQYKVYYSPDYDTVSPPTKQLIIGTEDDRRHDSPCCNPWVAHYMTIYPAFGLDWNAEANNKQAASGQWVGFRQNASGFGPSNIFRMQAGRWYTFEVRRRLNDSGVDNGIFQMWIDGILLSDHTNVRYRVPWNGTYGSNFTHGTNFVMISDYGGPITRDQSVYYDDVKLSTAPIGTGSAGTAPPSAPTNVRVIR